MHIGSVDKLDLVFGALADPTRRAMLARLALGEANVSELAEPFEISLPAITKHLNVLERAGLINRRRIGRLKRCSLVEGAMEEASAWLADHRASGRSGGQGGNVQEPVSV